MRSPAARAGSGVPAELPRVRVERDLEPDERCCPTCKAAMARIGQTVSEEVDYVPCPSRKPRPR